MFSFALLVATAVVVVLSFITIKLSFELKLLKETLKDKDAKYHSLLSYIETLKAATKPNKSIKKS
jgi:hypothetical protein